MNIDGVLPPPNLLGAPDKYNKWRVNQAEAVMRAIDSRKRFVIQALSTGSGKSLAYIVQALLTDSRTMILTSTKALQSQLYNDFAVSGLVEIRGLNSYPCVEGKPGGIFGDMKRDGYRAERGLPMMCDEAPCQSGAFCARRDGGCEHYDAKRKASMVQSRLVIANYAYWMSANQFGEGMGEFDLLVMDEAHDAVEELGRFIGTEIGVHEIDSVLPGKIKMMDPGTDQGDWREWGGFWSADVGRRLESIRATIKEQERTGDTKTGERISYSALRMARDLRRLQHKLDTVAGMRDEWIIDHVQDVRGRPVVKFDPIWPGSYAEEKLFVGIKKVIMVSATVRPETAEMLGIGRGQFEFNEYPSNFPKKNRPIIFIPSGAMNMRVKSANKREWMARIDQIIARRLDRKGIIHTVSYQRAREIYGLSEWKQRMIIHDSTNTREVIEAFKRSKENLILVSPSVTTGYDFAYEQAEYQIIAKVPFPDSRDKIMKARTGRDPNYRNYATMLALVQAAGRICRAEDDRGETFIVDSDFGWFINKNYKLAPKWFIESIVQAQVLGSPLPKINSGRR